MGSIFSLIYNIFFGSWIQRHISHCFFDKLLNRAEKAKSWVPMALVLALPLLLFVVMVLIASGSDETDSVNRALSSLVRNNEAVWQEQMHPEYGKEFMDMDAYLEKLAGRGIVLGSDATLERVSEVSKTASEYGRGKLIETSFSCGGYKYGVEALYIDDDKGRGIAEFRISLISWPKPSPSPSPGFKPPVRDNG